MPVAWTQRHRAAEAGISAIHGPVAVLIVIAGAALARLLLGLMLGPDLLPSEAALWVAGRAPGLGEADGQPVAALLIALASVVCGDAEVCLRAPGILANAAAAWVVWRLGLLLYDRRVAFWAAVLFVTLPVTSATAAVTGPAALLPLFWGGALYALLRGLKTDHRGWWMVLGLLLGVGLLTDLVMALFVPAFVVYALVSPEYHALWRRVGLWLALLIGLAIAAPALVWLTIHSPPPLPQPTPAAGLAFLGGLALLFGPVPLAVLAWVALHPGGLGPQGAAGGAGTGSPGAGVAAPEERLRRGYRTRFFLSFSLPVVILAGIAALSGMTVPPASTATAGIGACLLVSSWLLHTAPRRVLLRATVVLHVIGAGVVLNGQALSQMVGLPLPSALDPFAAGRGTAPLTAWVQALTQTYPQARLVFDDPKVLRLMQYHVRPHLMTARLLPGGRGEAPDGGPPVASGEPMLVILREDGEPQKADARPAPDGLRDAGVLAVERSAGRWLTFRAFWRPGDPT